jgi:hypothetical protein
MVPGMETEELKENVEDLTSHVSDYLDTLYRLTLLKVTQKATNLASTRSGRNSCLYTRIVCIIFRERWSGLVAWRYTKKQGRRFFIIAGFYFLLLFIIILLAQKELFFLYQQSCLGKIYE